MNIGEINELEIADVQPSGILLKDSAGVPAYMSIREFEGEFNVGDQLPVFVYTDKDGKLLATTKECKISLNKFAALKVLENSGIGTFMDWGLSSDLLVPFSEQDQDLIEGEKYITYLYLDERSQRLRGSTVFYEHLDQENITVKVGDEVDLMICEESDLGITTIVNGVHEGLLYNDEVYEVLNVGQQIKGYVKKIRPDNKIDLSLQRFGYRHVEPNAQKILTHLQKNDGFLGLTDKSDPEVIRHQMNMSKKTFKKALGALYKKRLITLEENGVYLVK